MTVVVGPGTGGPALTVQILGFRAASVQSIARVINFPNPGGDAARYPVRAGAPPGTVTTLVIQFAKPVSSARITYGIYDLQGALVRALPGTAFTLRAGPGQPTADEKWVYEHDWDGRTDAGADAASGVYFYRVKVGDEVKTGKLMLIR
jgi:hypothetical protein